MNNIYEKIKQNYGISYQREAKEIVTESNSYESHLSEIEKFGKESLRSVKPSSVIEAKNYQKTQKNSTVCQIS